MLKKIARFFVGVTEKYMPDPYLFAVILTAIVFIASLVFTDATPFNLISIWGNGLWGLLAFTMQMCTIIVFGTAFAKTPAIEKVLDWFCNKAKKPTHAYFMASFVAGLFSLLCWSTGLIVGAFMARELSKRVKGCHYPLLVAAGYSGFLTFQQGLTGSVSLLIATPGNFMEDIIGGLIPVSQTMLAPYNLIVAGLLAFILVPLLLTRLAPDSSVDEIVEVDPSIFGDDSKSVNLDKSQLTPGEKIENARIINIVVGIVGIIFLSRHFVGGGSLTINITNMLFFILAILLTDTPRRFIDNCIEGGKSLGPLAMQFPLYAGIMAMMIQTGLATKIANGFVSISTTTTFPLWTFISAGITNFFIPSGGSQWSVQGPIMIEAAKMMDADLARTAMAVAWGDQWTNMLQPFWALPLLAIANLRARDIMGYLVLVFILSGIVFGLGIMFLP